MNTGCRSSLSHRDEGPSSFRLPLPAERQLNAEPDGLDGVPHPLVPNHTNRRGRPPFHFRGFRRIGGQPAPAESTALSSSRDEG